MFVPEIPNFVKCKCVRSPDGRNKLFREKDRGFQLRQRRLCLNVKMKRSPEQLGRNELFRENDCGFQLRQKWLCLNVKMKRSPEQLGQNELFRENDLGLWKGSRPEMSK